MTTLRHPEERHWSRERKQLQPTLDEILPKIVEKVIRKGQPHKGLPRRLRAVHRLDRETSGLMVFARTVDAESRLGKQFRTHSLDRLYVAVVLGRITARTIESLLVEDRGDGRRGVSRDPHQGKRAVTHVRPLEYLGDYTLVECRLETGRTHQIRIHLAEAGFPLCGDKLYRGPFPGKPIPDQSRASRVALHSAELGLQHPITGSFMKFVMMLPSDLSALLNRLRKQASGASASGDPLELPPPEREEKLSPAHRVRREILDAVAVEYYSQPQPDQFEETPNPEAVESMEEFPEEHEEQESEPGPSGQQPPRPRRRKGPPARPFSFGPAVPMEQIPQTGRRSTRGQNRNRTAVPEQEQESRSPRPPRNPQSEPTESKNSGRRPQQQPRTGTSRRTAKGNTPTSRKRSGGRPGKPPRGR